MFDALHTNTAGKSDISIIIGNNKCACKVRKKSTLLLCSTVCQTGVSMETLGNHIQEVGSGVVTSPGKALLLHAPLAKNFTVILI